MAEYEPPREILPIFDPEDFIHTNDEPLTLETASKYFLKFPYGQGLEHIPNLIVGSTTQLNGTLYVAGTSDFNDNVNISVAGSGVANPTVTIQSNNDDDKGAYLKFYKNSQSPADGDRTGCLTFWSKTLNGSGGVGPQKEMGRFRNSVMDYTHNAEDAKFNFMLMKGGTLTEVANLTSTSLDLLTDINFTQAGAGTIIQSGTGQNELKSTNVIGTLLVNGTPVSGGGTLAQTLQLGNSAGSYSIDMNGNNINNINNLTLSTPAVTGEKFIYLYRALNTSNGSSLGTISWNGLSSTSVSKEYATMNATQAITTNGAEYGMMLWNVRENGALVNYMKMGREFGTGYPFINMYKPTTINVSNYGVPLSIVGNDFVYGDSPLSIEIVKKRTGGSGTNDLLGDISFKANSTTGTILDFARVGSYITDATNSNYAGGLSFNVAFEAIEAQINPIMTLDFNGGMNTRVKGIFTSNTSTPLNISYNIGVADVGYLRMYKKGNTTSNTNGMGIEFNASNSVNNETTQGRIRSGWINRNTGVEASQIITSLVNGGSIYDAFIMTPTTSTLNSGLSLIKFPSSTGTQRLLLDNQITGVNGAITNEIAFNSDDSAGTSKQTLSLTQSIIDATPATYSTETIFKNMINNVLTKVLTINSVIRSELPVINVSGFTALDRGTTPTTLGENIISMTNYDTQTALVGQKAHSINMYNRTSAGSQVKTFALEQTIINTTPATYSTENVFKNIINNVLTKVLTINSIIRSELPLITASGFNGFDRDSGGLGSNQVYMTNYTTVSATNGQISNGIYMASRDSAINNVQTFALEQTITDVTPATYSTKTSFYSKFSNTLWNVLNFEGGYISIPRGLKYNNVEVALTGNVSYAGTFYFLGGDLVITSNSSIANTITIPAISTSSSGFYLWIRNESNTAFIISSTAVFTGTYGSGATTQTIYPRQNIRLYCNGTNWKVVEFVGSAQTFVFKNTGTQQVNSGTITTCTSPTTNNLSWSGTLLTNTAGVISNGTGEDMTINVILTYTWTNNVNSATNAVTTFSNGNRSHWIQHSNTTNYPKYLGTYNVNPNTTTAGSAGTTNIYFRETLYASLTSTFLLKNGETFTPVAYHNNNVVSTNTSLYLYSTSQLDAFAMTITRVQ